MLPCLKKHELKPPETASYLVAFTLQVSWLAFQLEKLLYAHYSISV